MPKSAAVKKSIVIDLNGTNAKGEPTFAGYTLMQAVEVAMESSHPEAFEWLRCWWNADLTTMNSTPERW